MNAQTDCPFCEIVRREDPDTREVYRDENVVAFFPLEPATLGHTLLVPRKHTPDVWSLDEETAAHLARVTLRLSQAVKRATQPEGLNIIQSNGAVATQTVFHLHIHIIPRWSSDELGRIWPPDTSYSETQKDDAWERLRSECKKVGMVTHSTAKAIGGDDRRKHLDFIQAVVTRMSSASSAAKGWLLPVATVVYGYALTRKAVSVAALGITVVFLFGFLDANYLRQERAYRRLYDAVASGSKMIPLFSLDSSHTDDPIPQAATWWRKTQLRVGRWFPGRSVWLSWSVAPFYGALVLIGCFIIFVID